MDLIGQMRQVVKLCLNQPTQRGAGWQDNYGILLTTRGRLKQSSGYRNASEGEIQGDKTFELIVRYQQAIESTISISSKWLIDGVFYTIHSWEKKDQETFLYYRFLLHKKAPPTEAVGSLLPIDTTGLQTYYTSTSDTGTALDLGVDLSEVLLVSRSGVIWNKVASNPGDFQFSVSGSVITFGTAFNPGGEYIYVMYAQ